MSLFGDVNLEHAQRAVPCNVCEDEVPGEYYCVECKQTLCPQCEKNHRRVAGTKNHNIVLRAQVADIDASTLNCEDHSEPASCHCEKCNIPVCIKCVTGKHKGHAMSDLADIFEMEKKMLQNDIKAMQRDLSTLKTHREEILSEKENYKKSVRKILKDMEDEIQELQRIHKKRVSDVDSIQDSHLSVFEQFVEETNTKILSFEKRILEYKDAMAKNSLSALRNVSRGRGSLSEIGRKSKLPDPPTFVPVKIQSIAENIGKLFISSYSPMSELLRLETPTIASKFKNPLQGFPRICITKEGDVWLGGHGFRELVMVDIKGHVLKRRKIQNRPAALAVMDCGDVIISPNSDDSTSVSRLLRDGKEQHLYDTSPSYSYGVSVTADQEILICTEDMRVIRINGDGTNVKQIYKGLGERSAIHAVQASNSNIYISNMANRAVVTLNRYGKVLSTITHTTGGKQLKWPRGLVVDKMDNILCADKDNNCVYIIDQNQQMRKLLGRSHGIQNPQWLAVDNENNLWITQNDGTVHVVKYLFS